MTIKESLEKLKNHPRKKFLSNSNSEGRENLEMKGGKGKWC